MRRIRTDSVGHMEVRPVSARALHTIGPEDSHWSDGGGQLPELAGALVRVLPPASATDSQIYSIQCALYEAGAAMVRVRSREAHSQAACSVREANDETTSDPRAVIASMIAAAHTERKAELAELVEGYVSKCEPKKVGREFQAIDPGHITGIRIKNFERFKGQFELELGPGDFTIVARDNSDPEISNWLGKSSFIRAIKYALSGKHPKGADAWIHYGEKSGSVEIEFSNDVFVSRQKARKVGDSLEVNWGDRVITGNAAQTFIDQALIDPDMLAHVASMDQKKTSKFVEMGPTDLTNLVNNWIGIEWLSDAHDLCRDDLSLQTQALEVADRHIAQFNPIENEEGIRARIQVLDGEILEQRSLQTTFDERATAKANWLERKRQQAERQALKVELDRLKKPVKPFGIPDDLNASIELKSATVGRLKADYERASELEMDGFDGKCPVACVECPIVDQINAKGDEARERASAAKAAYLAQAKALGELKARRDGITEALEAYRRDHFQYRQLEERLEALPIVELGEEPVIGGEGVADRIYELQTEMRDLQATLDASREDAKRLVECQARAAALREQIDLQRQAMLILGPNGVQRRIADGCLTEIRNDTNRALEIAQIDLTVSISWARETQKLAEHCDNCGAAFPSSARVKSCGRCLAERGKKLSHKLEMELDHVSGGADDAAGIAFQFAAMQWLKRHGRIAWGIYFIDEPFGALDRAKVRTLGAQLGRLLKELFGAQQSFTVAHHADVLESASGRILVTGDSTGQTSEIRVL